MLQFIIFASHHRATMEGLAQILPNHTNVAAEMITLDPHAPVSIDIPEYMFSHFF